MVENPNGPFQKHENEGKNSDVEMMDDEDISDSEDDNYPESEEFQSIDNQLDMLNSVLDNLEQKNDVILAELTTLLNENREIRKQLQQSQTNELNNQPNN